MKKVLFPILAVVLVLGLALPTAAVVGAAPATMTVVSDGTTEWSADGISWTSAVACWTHGSWPNISGATWIWRTSQTDPAGEYDNVPDGGWYFRRIFDMPTGAIFTSGSISIGADNAYYLYVNGNPIGGDGALNKDGPDSQQWKSVETYDITSYLTTGQNTFLIRAINYFKEGLSPPPGSGYSPGYPYDDPTMNPAGLIFKAVIEYEVLKCADLIAGGGNPKSEVDVGDVNVWNDGDYLYVQYVVDAPGWCLTETHLHVAMSMEAIPQKNGNPPPGQFDYKTEHACVTEYTYEIPLEWTPCTDLYIAAHADVHLTEAVVYGTERGPGGASDNYGDIYEIDLDSGTATYLFRPNLNLGQRNYPNGNAFDTVNNRLYYSSNDSESTPSDLYFYDFVADTQTLAGTLFGLSAGAAFYNGKYYYVVNYTDDLRAVSFDPDGTLASDDPVWTNFTGTTKSFGFGDMVITTNGILFGSPGGEFFKIDLNTNTYTTISTSAGAEGKQLAFGSDGVLYGHSAGTGEFFIIDPTNGTTTSIGSVTGSATGQFTDLASGPLPRVRETAWGYCEPNGGDFPGKNWATYFTYHVE